MQNKKIINLAEGTDNSDAVTKHQLEIGLAPKANKTELNNYILKSGLTNNLDMKNNKIVNLKIATSGNDAVNFTQLNNELSKYLHLTGGTMEGDIQCNNNSIYRIENVSNDTSAVNRKYVNDELKKKADKTELSDYQKKTEKITLQDNMDANNKLIQRVKNPVDNQDGVNKQYLKSQLASKSDTNTVILRDGSRSMSDDLDMNNFQISNVKNATHNQDAVTLKQVNDGIATVSTQNIEYTDRKIAESHISTHENRKNALKYAMDDGELTTDFGIQDANLITYNDSPHQTNKKAFTMKIQKTLDGSNLFKGRFDFNLFKLIRDISAIIIQFVLKYIFKNILFTVWNSILLRLVLKK